jgi:hypothetical protein
MRRVRIVGLGVAWLADTSITLLRHGVVPLLSTAYLRRPVDFVTAVESRSEGVHAIIADLREARVAISAERGDDSRNGDRRVVQAEAGRARSYAFRYAELRWRLTTRDMEAGPG